MMRPAAAAHRPVLPAFGGALGGRAETVRDTTNGYVPRNQILKSTKLIHSDCNLLSGPFAVQFSRGHVEKVSFTRHKWLAL